MNYDNFMAVLPGGAIGDGLGENIEFYDSEFISNLGPEEKFLKNIQLSSYNFTDDTQMTLFTAEGIINYVLNNKNSLVEEVHKSYLIWLKTQKIIGNIPATRLFLDNSELYQYDFMHVQRAPGGTCIGVLKNTNFIGEFPENFRESDGCGAIMRSAPFGMVYEPDEAYKHAVDCGKLTHAHPHGFLPAGIFSYLISSVLRGTNIKLAAIQALEFIKNEKYYFREYPEFIKLEELMGKTIFNSNSPTNLVMENKLGEGWDGATALAITLYSVLSTNNYKDAITRALYHGGDSDSTASMTGNLAGAIYGSTQLLPEVKNKLNNLSVVDEYSTHLWKILN